MKNDKNRYCPQNSSLFVLFMAIFAAEIFMHPHPKNSYSYHEAIVAKGNILLLPLLIELLLAYKTC